MQAKPGSIVHISNAMPDIESLMQQWPLEVEQQLHTVKLPDASLVSRCCMCRTACTMLHLQFMLWSVCIASGHTDCPALSKKLLIL